MRTPVILCTAWMFAASGCGGNCGTLEIGGHSGFGVFIGDLDREVPIEGSYKNKCAVRVTPADAPINASTAYIWQAEYGYWEEHVEFVVQVDHKNREIDVTYGPYFWPAMYAFWPDVQEGETLSLDNGKLWAAVMEWERAAPSIDDGFWWDGEPVSDVKISWPVSEAELEILSITPSSDACESLLGEVYIKARYYLRGEPTDDESAAWFEMSGREVFITTDASLYCGTSGAFSTSYR